MQKNRWLPRILGATLLALVTTTVAAGPAHLEPGSRLPAFEFPNLEGETSSFRDFKGKRFILHVFASW